MQYPMVRSPICFVSQEEIAAAGNPLAPQLAPGEGAISAGMTVALVAGSLVSGAITGAIIGGIVGLIAGCRVEE